MRFVQSEDDRHHARKEASRSTDPLVYALEDVEESCSRGVPYERAIQVARCKMGFTRSDAVESIEQRIEDDALERVSADRLGTE